MNTNKLKDIASQVRRDIVRQTSNAQSGHPGGSLGTADFFTLMYNEVLKHDTNFNMPGQGEDVFFLSNGHISPVWYSTLAHAGYFDPAELNTFRMLNSRLQGHPTTHENLPGIRIASGSLGQGLSAAIGLALTKNMNKDDNYIYVLMGDGELQEGQIWEAAMFAAHYKLNKLIAVVDWNGQQIDGSNDDVISLGDLKAKWSSFGWEVFEMDGHSFNNMNDIINNAKKSSSDLPKVILMRTVMGKGVDFMEGTHQWHGKAPNAEQTKLALSQLNETLGDF